MRSRMPEVSFVRRARLASTGGVLASLALHLSAFLALRWVSALPDVGFELQLPSEAEFGVLDGAQLQQGALAPSPAPTPAPAPPPAPAPAAVTASPSGVDQKPKPKKKRPKPKPEPTDAGVPADDTLDARDDAASGGGAEGAALAALAPKGAQLSLRVDIDRVRASPLADQARALLQAVPDVQMILDGSGIDPLETLSRLFIASPNLKRESVVIAGRYTGGDDVARNAAERLATLRGKSVKWRARGGIPTAAWENKDETPRVLALLAPTLFAITRPDDLPRVLAVARTLAARIASERPDAGDVDPSAALLAMREGELLVFAVENTKAFVRGRTEGIPDRLEVSIVSLPDTRIEIRALGVYASPQDAEDALQLWTSTRDRFARHPLVALTGMSTPLRETTLQTDAERLTAVSHLTPEDAQRILRFVTDALSARARSDVPASPPTTQPP